MSSEKQSIESHAENLSEPPSSQHESSYSFADSSSFTSKAHIYKFTEHQKTEPDIPGFKISGNSVLLGDKLINFKDLLDWNS
jgi:hypothetical protein